MVYYLAKNGEILNSDDLERAFYICTGKYSYNSEKEFWKFREKCFGKSIVQTIAPSIDYFLENGHLVKAIKFYKETHNCSLMEARDFIYKECKKYPRYNYLV